MDEKFNQQNNAIYTKNFVFNTHYHLVWVTKYHNSVFFTDSILRQIKDMLTYVAQKSHITIEEMEVIPDHVHLVLNFRPSLSITNVVRQLKGNSARLFLRKYPQIKHDRFWEGHLWSHSYYVGTIGNVNKKTIDQYIQNQYYQN